MKSEAFNCNVLGSGIRLERREEPLYTDVFIRLKRMAQSLLIMVFIAGRNSHTIKTNNLFYETSSRRTCMEVTSSMEPSPSIADSLSASQEIPRL
jgi:hypothetical protein